MPLLVLLAVRRLLLSLQLPLPFTLLTLIPLLQPLLSLLLTLLRLLPLFLQLRQMLLASRTPFLLHLLLLRTLLVLLLRLLLWLELRLLLAHYTMVRISRMAPSRTPANRIAYCSNHHTREGFLDALLRVVWVWQPAIDADGGRCAAHLVPPVARNIQDITRIQFDLKTKRNKPCFCIVDRNPNPNQRVKISGFPH